MCRFPNIAPPDTVFLNREYDLANQKQDFEELYLRAETEFLLNKLHFTNKKPRVLAGVTNFTDDF